PPTAGQLPSAAPTTTAVPPQPDHVSPPRTGAPPPTGAPSPTDVPPPTASSSVAAEPEEGIHSAEMEALIREAMENRSDLKQRESAFEAARKQVSLARGDYYPTLGFEGTYIIDRMNFSPFAEKTDWSAQVSVSILVFDGGRERASVATASSRLRQSGLDSDVLTRT